MIYLITYLFFLGSQVKFAATAIITIPALIVIVGIYLRLRLKVSVVFVCFLQPKNPFNLLQRLPFPVRFPVKTRFIL